MSTIGEVFEEVGKGFESIIKWACIVLILAAGCGLCGAGFLVYFLCKHLHWV